MRFTRLAPLLLLLGTPAFASTDCTRGFTQFLAEFERGRVDQAAHTLFPLRYAHPDLDDPDMAQKVTWLRRDDAALPVPFPSPEEQARRGLGRAIAGDAAGRCAVKFNAPDSDIYAVTFRFALRNGRWLLVEIEDYSL